jgi:uncharacterized membrane protein
MNALGTLNLLQKVFVVAPQKRNVGTTDRLVSSAAGLLLAYAGTRMLRKGGFPLLIPATYLLWRGASGYCHMYNFMGIDTTEGAKPFLFTQNITIKKSRKEVYRYWRQLENLPYIMTHIAKVEDLSNNKYRWEAEFNKQHFSWNAQIIEDVPNEIISWTSVDSPDVENAGTVEFIDSPNGGTELRITISYKPAKTKLDRILALAFNPIFKRKIMEDLCQFKQKVEAGEIIFKQYEKV